MMGVTALPTEATVSALWSAYAAAMAPAVADPKLLLDRATVENVTEKEAAFRTAYLAWVESSPSDRQ